MRATLIAMLTALVLVAAGCGDEGNRAPPRSALAERLAQLCEETRLAVEELGEPREEGAAVFQPWSRLGLRFVDNLAQLRAQNARQRKQVASLAAYFKGFYDSLAYGYRLFQSGQPEQGTMTKLSLQRGYAQLESAERLAVTMGATECAERPFEAA